MMRFLIYELKLSNLMSNDSLIVICFTILVFIIIPLILIILEYKITIKSQKTGLYFLLSIFVSFLFLGIYSIILGIINFIVYLVANLIRSLRSD